MDKAMPVPERTYRADLPWWQALMPVSQGGTL